MEPLRTLKTHGPLVIEQLGVHWPKSRGYMHLDTVITMYDRDLVTLFPQVINEARTWAIRPGVGGRGRPIIDYLLRRAVRPERRRSHSM